MDPTGPLDPAKSGHPDGPRPSDHTARLEHALSAVVSGQGSSAEVEAAVIAFVSHVRAEREPPERMLLRTKEILADVGLRPTYTSSGLPPDGKANLYRDVIAWCIRYYFDGG